MSVDRTVGRRKNHHRFQPALEGALESRALLSKVPGLFFLAHPKIGVAYERNQPPRLSAAATPYKVAPFPRGKAVQTETAHGGQTVIVGTPDGSHFEISLTQFIPPSGEGQSTSSSAASGSVPGTQTPIQGQTPGAGAVQPIGTVRAYAMPGGKVGIIVDGSTSQTELDISPLAFPQMKGYAHSFAYGQAAESHVLNIGQIIINTGQISAILGFHTADLSGPLQIPSSTTVDRIAFQDLLPGASIVTGGDLNTLDVYNGVNLTSGTGINIGRDLNMLNVGQNLDLSNGASLTVGRFLGATPQPPKGTATGSNFLALNQALVGTGTSTLVPSLSAYIEGNIDLGTGSSIVINSGIANSSISDSGTSTSPAVLLVNGTVSAGSAAQIAIPNIVASNTFQTPTGQSANFVARNGFNIPNP